MRNSLVVASLVLFCGCSGVPADSIASDVRAQSDPDVASAEVAGNAIFTQPSYNGITGHFLAPLCKTGIGADENPQDTQYDDKFVFVSWECPKEGGFVIDSFDASGFTGFSPNGGQDLGRYQIGYADETGTAVTQVDGNEVGVYLDSRSLAYDPCFSPGACKEIMTPQVKFVPGTQQPFPERGKSMLATFDLKTPTAHFTSAASGESQSYVVLDLLFQDSKHINPITKQQYQITVDVRLFDASQPTAEKCFAHVDADSQNLMINCPLVTGSPYLTPQKGVGATALNLYQGTTWKTYKAFGVSISTDEFAQVLSFIYDALGGTFSRSPEDYSLVEVHMNGEMHTIDAGLTTLGYAMRGLQVSLQ